MTDERTPSPSRLRSVRARVAVVVAALSGVAFGAVAAVAPSSVGGVLQDDLLTAEAENAFAFIEAFTLDDGEIGTFVLGADGQPFDPGPGVVFDIETPATTGNGPVAGPLDDVDLDGTILVDEFDVGSSDAIAFLAVREIIEARVELLRSVGEFDQLIVAAGGSFATDIDPVSFAVIDPDGSIELVQGDPEDLDVPIMTQFELDDFLFDDLGIFEDPSGAVVDLDTGARLLFGVRDVDDLSLLVVADATTVDRSVERVRLGLWLAVPFLTIAVAGLAWAVTGRALRPVRSITDQAATISGGSLDARVPVPDSGDEVATLATTVNQMLDRLEADDTTRRRFVSDASHELRSPVAVMRNEAEVALHHPEGTDIGELAATVAGESKRMSTIIDDLLALARHDEGVTAPDTEVDLDDIVLAEARRSRRVPIDVGKVSAGRVRGRSDEIGRMVGHLLDNAARHAHSTVSVSLRDIDGAVELTIDDDGPGVPDDARDRIFERFARLDDARTRDQGGAGLGLAVVRGIAERSGGTVDVTDSTMGGARFVVRFRT